MERRLDIGERCVDASRDVHWRIRPGARFVVPMCGARDVANLMAVCFKCKRTRQATRQHARASDHQLQ